jgi:cyclophilin family peptidyl-prolyl cis-trans isomerase
MVFVIDADGNKTEISDEPFALRFDSDADTEREGPFSPVLTQNIEATNTAQVARTTTQCGQTRQERAGTKNWQVTIEAIITTNNRNGNLSVARSGTIGDGTPVTITTELDFLNGTHIVSDITISTLDEVETIRTSETDGQERAYGMELVLGEEESE